jgi:hypothetical protein
MSENTGQTASQINAQTASQRASEASARVVSPPAVVTPATVATRKSRATRGADKSSAAKSGSKTSKTAAPKAATPVKLATPKVTGPTDTLVKRSAAIALVTIIGDAFGKLSDAAIKRALTDAGYAGKLTDAEVAHARDLFGLTWGSALNYIPTPADRWSDKLPARNFTGGRGTKTRRAA